jgi:hypothetical protein
VFDVRQTQSADQQVYCVGAWILTLAAFERADGLSGQPSLFGE